MRGDSREAREWPGAATGDSVEDPVESIVHSETLTLTGVGVGYPTLVSGGSFFQPDVPCGHGWLSQ
jgi:hypothetical protein